MPDPDPRSRWAARVALALAGAAVVGGAALLWPPAGADPDPPGPSAADQPAPPRNPRGRMPKRVYEREDFRDLLAGRTEEEVVSLVGLPDSTAVADGWLIWGYARATRARGWSQIDASADLYFAAGRVAEIRFPAGPPDRGPMPREVPSDREE